MLRILQNTNPKSAKSYYSALSKASYYAGNAQEMVGSWGGKAAERLGLYGDVDQRSFALLVDNINPATEERLTARTVKNRRTGYDFNFHAPKSLSILYGMTGDTAILTIFRQAVTDVMQEIEGGVAVRVRKSGRYGERISGNAAWAEYIHFTSRPVEGVIDPHLHIHAFMLNASFDPVEQQWKAIDVAAVKSQGMQYQQRFHAILAERLEALGYAITRQGQSFEIEGIGRDTINRFSNRTRQVEEMAQKLGITDPHTKDRLGARTREWKQSKATMDELRREWESRLTSGERTEIALLAARRGLEWGGCQTTRDELDAWKDQQQATIADQLQHESYEETVGQAAGARSGSWV